MQPDSDKHILTERELALRWRRSQRTLQRWRNLGTGPAWMKIGYGVVYLLTDVIAYETQSRRDPSEAKWTPCHHTKCPRPTAARNYVAS